MAVLSPDESAWVPPFQTSNFHFDIWLSRNKSIDYDTPVKDDDG